MKAYLTALALRLKNLTVIQTLTQIQKPQNRTLIHQSKSQFQNSKLAPNPDFLFGKTEVPALSPMPNKP